MTIFDGNVAVSFSGGKDSTVLLDIARNHWRGHKGIKAIFIDTGLEFSGIRKFVKTFDNVEIIRPKMRFDEVIKKYGYPVISKTVAHNVRCARNEPNGKTVQNCFCEEKTGPYAMAKWNDLRFVDFNIDDRCCDIMKKQPAHEYSQKNGNYFMTAEMACESKKAEIKKATAEANEKANKKIDKLIQEKNAADEKLKEALKSAKAANADEDVTAIRFLFNNLQSPANEIQEHLNKIAQKDKEQADKLSAVMLKVLTTISTNFKGE